MIVKIGKKQEIEEYFVLPYLSQSELKAFAFDFEKYASGAKESDLYFDEPKTHFIIGSALDTFVTQGEEAYKEAYYISTLAKKPSDKVISIAHELLNILVEEGITPTNLFEYQEYISGILISQDYYSNYKPETRMNKFLGEANDYWLDLISSEGKQILTLEENNLIYKMAQTVYSNVFLKEAIESDRYLVYFQYPISTKLDIKSPSQIIYIKGLLDIVIYDKDTRKLYIIDLKTTWESILNFPKQVRKRNMIFQLAFYKNLFDLTSVQSRSPFRDYNQIITGFLVVSTTYPDTSDLFFIQDSIISEFWNGVLPSVRQVFSHHTKLFVLETLPGRLGIMDYIVYYSYYKEGHLTKEAVISLLGFSKLEKETKVFSSVAKIIGSNGLITPYNYPADVLEVNSFHRDALNNTPLPEESEETNEDQILAY